VIAIFFYLLKHVVKLESQVKETAIANELPIFASLHSKLFTHVRRKFRRSEVGSDALLQVGSFAFPCLPLPSVTLIFLCNQDSFNSSYYSLQYTSKYFSPRRLHTRIVGNVIRNRNIISSKERERERVGERERERVVKREREKDGERDLSYCIS